MTTPTPAALRAAEALNNHGMLSVGWAIHPSNRFQTDMDNLKMVALLIDQQTGLPELVEAFNEWDAAKKAYDCCAYPQKRLLEKAELAEIRFRELLNKAEKGN